jgi:hypothetical protein
VKYLVKLGPVAMPGRIAQDGEIVELEPADGDTLVRYGILVLVEEPTPDPSQEGSLEDKPVKSSKRKSATPEPKEKLEES